MRTPLFSRMAGLEPMFGLVADERNPREAQSMRRRFGFEVLTLHPANLIPFHAKNQLYNDASRRVGDALLGVRIGLAAAVDAFRPLVDLANAGTSLPDAVARTNAIMTWQSNVCSTHLRRSGDRARWTLHYPHRSSEPVLHHAAAPLVLMLGLVLRHGGDASDVVIEFDELPIAERRRAEVLLGVAVQPLVGGFAITFPARWLDTDVSLPPMESVAPLPEYAKRPLPTTVADAVRNVFEMHGENMDFDVDQVCAELGISRRMLQHGLTQEGVTYRDMLRHMRIARARRLLEDTDSPIADIAALTGYSDHANFHRAFVGVTGQTPGHFREARHSR